MHRSLFDLLDAPTRTRMAGAPRAELLALPLDVLEGVPVQLRTHLRDHHGAVVLYDLHRLDLDAIQISPGLIELLTCLLFYPKHDPGPDCAWEKLFGAAPLSTYTGWTGNPFHTHFGPVFYRGRLDGTAKVLVIGQDPATDETLCGRTFVGDAGQRVQRFLAKIGITRSYVMFNSVLFGIQSSSLTDAVVQDPTLTAYRNQLFDRVKATSPLSLVLAFGNRANTAALAWTGRGSVPLVHLYHPSTPSGVATEWNGHLAAAAAAVTPEGPVDLTPYASDPVAPADVPRFDLAFGTPAFMGTGGTTHSTRVTAAFETQITWTAP